VVCPAYPSDDNHYRLAFVHSRTRAYRRFGLSVDVFVVGETVDLAYREYEGQSVATGNYHALSALLSTGQYNHVAVHFLTTWPWTALREFRTTIPMTMWVHGYEAQPWWRRSYDLVGSQPTEEDKKVTEARMAVWKDALSGDNPALRLVFVSNAFKTEVTEDFETFGITVPETLSRVIHNPIDTTVFPYVAKTASARKKVLVVRPFESRKYGTDLAVKAIMELSGEPEFHEFEFRIVGSGSLFAETTEPLRGFSNVTLQETFLSQDEMAALFRQYGVFLTPTRCDSQGVSRDEASSCGMVPVTSALAAVQEFCSPAEGFLAPPEDFTGLADAMMTMYHDQDLFLRLSAAAAARVRRQTDAEIIIPQEIALLSETLQSRLEEYRPSAGIGCEQLG